MTNDNNYLNDYSISNESLIQKALDKYLLELDPLPSEKIDNFKNRDYQEELLKYFDKYNIKNILDIDNNINDGKTFTSKDPTTKNIDYLLNFIHRRFPTLYSQYADAIMEHMDFRGSEFIFIGDPMDDYRLDSNLLVLNYLLSKSSTRHYGEKLLNVIINGDYNYQFEFNCLLMFLLDYSRLPEQEKLKNALLTMKETFETGNKEHVIDNMRKLTILINEGLTFPKARSACGFDQKTNSIVIDDYCLNGTVLSHELGHAIDARFNTNQNNHKEKIAAAKNHIIKNPHIETIIKNLNDRITQRKNQIEKQYDEAMIKKYGSKEKAIEHLKKYIMQMVQDGSLEQLYDEFNCSEITINSLKGNLQNNVLNYDILANSFYKDAKNNFVNKVFYSTKELEIIDIICSIFGDNIIEFKNETIEFVFGHSRDYYRVDSERQMKEIYADFNALLSIGNKETLDLLKEIVGEEFYEYIVSIRNEGRIINDQVNPERKMAV